MSSLYLEHFRLAEPPFGITPNGRFFFEGQERGAILDALQHAVLDEDGIIVVVGEVGSGKTMLSRMLAERLPREQVDLVYLANPSFGPREILLSLIADWGLKAPGEGQSPVLTIQEALLERHAQGRRAVALIDEAQAMQPESLEEIKLLSNLETAQQKLLQIVLFGQPELDDLLAQPRLRQVRDRVVHRFELQPLAGPDAAAYIEHRLRRAGWQGGALFEPRALRRLIDASGGRIRAIHQLADKALLAAFAQGARQVSAEHVRLAGEDIRGARRPARPAAARWRRPLAWLALALAGAGAAGALGYGLGRRAEPAPVALPAEPPAATPPAQASGPLPERASASVAVSPPSGAPEAAPGAVSQRYAALAPALREAVLRTRAVFDDPAQEFWTLRIGIAANAEGAQRLLALARQSQEPVWVHERAHPSGNADAPPVWAVYVGRHTDRAQAGQSLEQWPAPLKAYKPLALPLSGLRAQPYPERLPS